MTPLEVFLLRDDFPLWELNIVPMRLPRVDPVCAISSIVPHILGGSLVMSPRGHGDAEHEPAYNSNRVHYVAPGTTLGTLIAFRILELTHECTGVREKCVTRSPGSAACCYPTQAQHESHK